MLLTDQIANSSCSLSVYLSHSLVCHFPDAIICHLCDLLLHASLVSFLQLLHLQPFWLTSPSPQSPRQPGLEGLCLHSAPPLGLWPPPWQAQTTLWPQSDAAACMVVVLNGLHPDSMSLSLQGDERWNHSGQSSLGVHGKLKMLFSLLSLSGSSPKTWSTVSLFHLHVQNDETSHSLSFGSVCSGKIYM